MSSNIQDEHLNEVVKSNQVISNSNSNQDNNEDEDYELPVLPFRPDVSVPLTVLTGWLGSGKTTLLHNFVKYIAEQKNQTVAILQNETSSFMGVEKSLKLTDDEKGVFGEMLEIANGCVCCSVRSDFLLAIDTLLSKRRFDYVLLECSGIADVGNLITSLWADRELECGAYLDSVVCLVDSTQVLHYTSSNNITNNTTKDTQNKKGNSAIDKYIDPSQLQNDPSSMLNILKNQIVYSDVVIVNKLDQFDFNHLITSSIDDVHHNANNNDLNDGDNADIIQLKHQISQFIAAEQQQTKKEQENTQKDNSKQNVINGVLQYLNTNYSTFTNSSSTKDDQTDNNIDQQPQQQQQQQQQKSLTTLQYINPKLYKLLDYINNINPTVDMLYTHHSNINIGSILNLNKYDMSNCTTNISRTIQQYLSNNNNDKATHKNSQHTIATQHGNTDDSTMQDKPKRFWLINGVKVWTENENVIPFKYRHTEGGLNNNNYTHNHHQDSCCNDDTCNDSHQHQDHDHVHNNDCCTHNSHHEKEEQEKKENKPHGITTIVLTYQPHQEVAEYEDADGNNTFTALDPLKWGLDLQKLKINLDYYLFEEKYQREDLEQQWAEERLEYRTRFHELQEDVETVVEDLIKKSTNTLGVEIVPDMDGNNNNDPTNNDDNNNNSPSEIIYRMKGVFSIHQHLPKWYLQCVFNTFELLPAEHFQERELSPEEINDVYSCDELYDLTDDIDEDGNIIKKIKDKDLWYPLEQRYCSMIVIGVNLNVEKLVNLFIKSQYTQDDESNILNEEEEEVIAE